MNEKRNAHAITMCRGKVYVLGGFCGKSRLNTVESYVPKDDSWNYVASMTQNRHYLAACSIADKYIYAFGGFYGSSDKEINDSIECYDVDKNEWQLLAIKLKVSLDPH